MARGSTAISTSIRFPVVVALGLVLLVCQGVLSAASVEEVPEAEPRLLKNVGAASGSASTSSQHQPGEKSETICSFCLHPILRREDTSCPCPNGHVFHWRCFQPPLNTNNSKRRRDRGDRAQQEGGEGWGGGGHADDERIEEHQHHPRPDVGHLQHRPDGHQVVRGIFRSCPLRGGTGRPPVVSPCTLLEKFFQALKQRCKSFLNECVVLSGMYMHALGGVYDDALSDEDAVDDAESNRASGAPRIAASFPHSSTGARTVGARRPRLAELHRRRWFSEEGASSGDDQSFSSSGEEVDQPLGFRPYWKAFVRNKRHDNGAEGGPRPPRTGVEDCIRCPQCRARFLLFRGCNVCVVKRGGIRGFRVLLNPRMVQGVFPQDEATQPRRRTHRLLRRFSRKPFCPPGFPEDLNDFVLSDGHTGHLPGGITCRVLRRRCTVLEVSRAKTFAEAAEKITNHRGSTPSLRDVERRDMMLLYAFLPREASSEEETGEASCGLLVLVPTTEECASSLRVLSPQLLKLQKFWTEAMRMHRDAHPLLEQEQLALRRKWRPFLIGLVAVMWLVFDFRNVALALGTAAQAGAVRSQVDVRIEFEWYSRGQCHLALRDGAFIMVRFFEQVCSFWMTAGGGGPKKKTNSEDLRQCRTSAKKKKKLRKFDIVGGLRSSLCSSCPLLHHYSTDW